MTKPTDIDKWVCKLCKKQFTDRKNYWHHTNKIKTPCISKERAITLVEENERFTIQLEQNEQQLEKQNEELAFLRNIVQKNNEINQKDEPEKRVFYFFKYLMKLDPKLLVEFVEHFKDGIDRTSMNQFINTIPKPKRVVVAETKKIVAHRQDFKCKHCQIIPLSYEIDHIVPLYLGGTNNKDNLQMLCANCHSDKTVKDYDDFHFNLVAFYDGTINE